MAKPIKHPEFAGVTNETHPHIFNAADGTWYTPETKPGAFKKDGTPTKFIDRAAIMKARTEANAAGGVTVTRRSDAEMLEHYKAKKLVTLDRHVKELAKIEKRIEYFSGNRPSSRGAAAKAKANAALGELLGKGFTPEQIAAFAEQARLAMAGLKGKSEDEIKALIPPPFAPAVPPMPGA